MKTEDLSAQDERREAELERDRVRRGLRYCLGVFLGLRIGLSLLALAGVALLPGLDPVDVPGWPAHPTTPGWHNLVTSWERFDALWFLRIATAGYVDGDGSAAFFPLYPLTIRAVSPLMGGHPLAAAFLVSNASALGAMVALYFLTASEFDETVARRTVLYLAVFPTSFFLLAPYSESLFLVLVLVSLWAARRSRWWLAGAAAALAATTRNLGVLLVLPLVVEAVHQSRERRRSPVMPLVASVGAMVGLAAYLGYWEVVSGDALAPIHQQATWLREFSFPWVSVLRATDVAFAFVGVYPGGYHLMDWLLVTPALVAAVWVALRTRPLYGVYTWAGLLAPLSFIFEPRPYMSLPRFLLPLFPILWAGAVWAGRRRGVHEALVAVSAGILGLFTVLFVNWYFVF
ncbi:MAG: mannosyltransferase family protein [Actinomycetota bacterium]